MVENLLEIRNLNLEIQSTRGKNIIVRNNSFNLKSGEVLGIVGESGCGKSLTSLSIMGLLPQNISITQGDIVFNGESLLDKCDSHMRKIRGNDISMIFQDPMTSLNPVMKIGKQLVEGILIHKKCSKKDAKKSALDMIEKVGIENPKEVFVSYPHQLSGGMQQRIMIAIAMICEPRLLIADEPTTALDATTQFQILKLMKKMCNESGASMILISHDMGVIKNMCDRMVVMYSGEAVEQISLHDFERGYHPYTQGLLKCIPSEKMKNTELFTIPGKVECVYGERRGCPFFKRCSMARGECFENRPMNIKIKDNHMVKCFLYKSEGEFDEPNGCTC